MKNYFKYIIASFIIIFILYYINLNFTFFNANSSIRTLKTINYKLIKEIELDFSPLILKVFEEKLYLWSFARIYEYDLEKDSITHFYGNKGNGPKEFQNIDINFVIDNGVLYAGDNGNYNISFLNRKDSLVFFYKVNKFYFSQAFLKNKNEILIFSADGDLETANHYKWDFLKIDMLNNTTTNLNIEKNYNDRDIAYGGNFVQNELFSCYIPHRASEIFIFNSQGDYYNKIIAVDNFEANKVDKTGYVENGKDINGYSFICNNLLYNRPSGVLYSNTKILDVYDIIEAKYLYSINCPLTPEDRYLIRTVFYSNYCYATDMERLYIYEIN